MKKPAWFAAVVLLGWHIQNVAAAPLPFAPSNEELLSLPELCTAKLRNSWTAPVYKHWEKALGDDFQHSHHYCFALNFINRYYRTQRVQEKRHYLNEAYTNLNYMVEHAKPEFSLMPDIYLNRGLVQQLRDKYGEAIADLRKSIELNPRQARAYSVLSEIYGRQNQAKQALELVTEGLRHIPDSKSLQRRYLELGGKQPFPAPYPTEPKGAVPDTTASPATKVQPAAASASADTAPRPPDSEVGQQTAPVDATTTPAQGVPGNPWCRFCPPPPADSTTDLPASRPADAPTTTP